MSRYVQESSDECRRLRAAFNAGTVEEVGGVAPCREMKWTGWRVVRWEGRLYACVVDTGGTVVCIDAIEPSELHLYDDGTFRAPSGEKETP